MKYAEEPFKQAGEFTAEGLQHLREGKFPQYYERAMPHMREMQMQDLTDAFYGTPMGGPGIYDQTRAAGAAGGLGPAAMQRQTMKVGGEYGRRAADIDRYLMELGAKFSHEAAQFLPQHAIGMTQATPMEVAFGPQTGFGYSTPGDQSASKAIGAMSGMAGQLMAGGGFTNTSSTMGGGVPGYSAYDAFAGGSPYSLGGAAQSYMNQTPYNFSGFGSGPQAGQVTSPVSSTLGGGGGSWGLGGGGYNPLSPAQLAGATFRNIGDEARFFGRGVWDTANQPFQSVANWWYGN
jgi:hypothetical protein